MNLYESLQHYFLDSIFLYIIAHGGYGKTSTLLQFYQDHWTLLGHTLYVCPTLFYSQQLKELNPYFPNDQWKQLDAKQAFTYILQHISTLDTIILDSVSLSHTYYNSILRFLMYSPETCTKRIYLLSSQHEMQIQSFFPQMITLHFQDRKYEILYHYIPETQYLSPIYQVSFNIQTVIQLCSNILFHRTIIYVATQDQCYVVARLLKRHFPYLIPSIFCCHSQSSRSHLHRIRQKLANPLDTLVLITTHFLNDSMILFRKIYYIFDFGIDMRVNTHQTTQIDWCDRSQIEMRAMHTGRDCCGIVFRLFPESYLSFTSFILPRRKLIYHNWIHPILVLHRNGYSSDIVSILGWESYSLWKQLDKLRMFKDPFLLHCYFKIHVSIYHCVLFRKLDLSIPPIEFVLLLLSIVMMDTIDHCFPSITLCPPWGNKSILYPQWKSIFLYPNQEENELHLYLSILITYLRLSRVHKKKFILYFQFYASFIHSFVIKWRKCISFFKHDYPFLSEWKQLFNSLKVHHVKLPHFISIPILFWDHSLRNCLSRFFYSISWIQLYPISSIYYHQTPPWHSCRDLVCHPVSNKLSFRLCIWLTHKKQSSFALFTYPYHQSSFSIQQLSSFISIFKKESDYKLYWKQQFKPTLLYIQKIIYYSPMNDGFQIDLLSQWFDSQMQLYQLYQTVIQKSISMIKN